MTFARLALLALPLALAACKDGADHSTFRRAEAVSMNRLWCDQFAAAPDALGFARAARFRSLGEAALFCAFVDQNRPK